MADPAQAAIDEALKRNWQKAIELNRQIIKESPSDIDALNRLAFALTESGEVRQARKIYNKVLQINRFNPIALKNLKRLTLLKTVKASGPKVVYDELPKNGHRSNSYTGLFLEEVGKTKVVTLINLAEAKIVTSLHATIPVLLVPRRRGVAVTTQSGDYIGSIPDDIASRLYMLIKGGNQYEAYVKSVNRGDVSIFIRESLRISKFKNMPSFVGKGTSPYFSFVREDVIVEEKPDVSRLEDLEDDSSDTSSDET